MQNKKQPYSNNGVTLSNLKIHKDDSIELSYCGLLAECGAEKVYAHVGYGDEWGGLEDIEMTWLEDGFKAGISIKMPGVLNVCFKDNVGNWDNNSGQNYSFKVTGRKSPGKTEKAKAAV